jgi:hypothetical protein
MQQVNNAVRYNRHKLRPCNALVLSVLLFVQTRFVGQVGEADDQGYWYHVSKDGNREAHYRGV